MKKTLFYLWLIIINRVMAFTIGVLIAITGLFSPGLCINLVESMGATSKSVDNKK